MNKPTARPDLGPAMLAVPEYGCASPADLGPLATVSSKAPSRRVPELLAPAGSLKMLDTALGFGATAIYAGQPRYSLRVRNNEFGDLPVLEEGIRRRSEEHTSELQS